MTIRDSPLTTENGGSCLPVAPGEEKRIVEELTKKSEANLKEGNIYYVISNRFHFYSSLLMLLIGVILVLFPALLYNLYV